ncbi:hypothetical protein Tco_1070147 [Tanacetum coccineum]|uniref:Uncharacterized protein n=1 Tax=Tanacetum coccineum TaxID=301880 RepID=A0ABQ5HKK1_9ASTR
MFRLTGVQTLEIVLSILPFREHHQHVKLAPPPISNTKENPAMFFQHQHGVNVLLIEMLEAEKQISKNQLLRIEDLGAKAMYAGANFRKPVEPY